LFAFLGRRDPKLTEDVVATIAVPKAARPKIGLSPKALRAKSVVSPRAGRAGATPAATRFASAIAKAATAAATRNRRTRPDARKRSAAAPGSLGISSSGWTDIGPWLIPNGQTYGTNRVDVSGRVASIAVDPFDPNHLLLGAAGGGIWEFRAGWKPRTDQMPSLAIGAVTFDPSKAGRAYAGSGEGNFYAVRGAGVYRSTDGGTTWTVLATAPFVGVGFYDLVVDPKTPKVLYAATTSGFYRSNNGGASWTLKRGGRCWDISVHPGGGTVEILAAFLDGLFVSTDAGNSFTAVPLPSKPTGAWSRLAVDRVTAAPDIAYVYGAIGSAARLWRRSGTTWSKITMPALNTQQSWYDWYVAVPPNNRGRVYVGAIDTLRGDLSGGTWKWTNITTQGSNSIHPDQHCLAFSPTDSNVIYAGNDGGIFRSANAGATWKALNKGLGITELEYLASDPNTWKWMMSGTQDNGTIAFIGSPAWKHIADGDGGDCGVNQLNPNVLYHSYYDMSLERSTNKGVTWASLPVPSMSSLFYPPVEVFVSTVAMAGNALAVTRTGTGPFTTVPLGLPANETATAMREIDANTILIGTNAGRLLRVSWNGTSWTKVALASPAARYISCIAVDPSNPQRVWVTYSQLAGGGGGSSVYLSKNGGTSWMNRTGTLPKISVNSVVVDPAKFSRVWVAADVGVYETLNLGATWASAAPGLPNAMAADLLFHKQDRMLICGTRNRGAWALPVP
jgi:hypothetical protein